MRWLLFLALSGCFQSNSKACRDMCPIGVKSFSGDKCECFTPEDLRIKDPK